MNNLSNERLKAIADIDSPVCMAFPPSHDQCAAMARELLAFREAAEKPVASMRRLVDKRSGKVHAWTYSGRVDGSTDGDIFCVEVRLLYTAPPLPVVPDGFCIMPCKITAENGAKGALLGEFLESKYISCPECFGDDDCESCDGSGRIKVDVTVSWSTIKNIYSAAVELLGNPEQVNSPVAPVSWIAAINRLLDSDGSRGCFSAIRCYDAHKEIEAMLAAAPKPK